MEATIIANSLANATSSTQEPLFAADIDLAVNIVSTLNKYIIIINYFLVAVVVVVVVVVAAAAAAAAAVVSVTVTFVVVVDITVTVNLCSVFTSSYCS